MELSGLIFVALAAVWAVVLLPMALRHHDEAAKTRAVDRFSDNLRVVARRDGVAARESRLVATSPARAARRRTPVDQPCETSARVERASLVEPLEDSLLQTHRSAAAVAARRRRKVLAALLAALVIVGAGSYLDYLQVWAPGVPAAVTVVFLALARVLARRESARWHSLVTARRNVGTAAYATDSSPLIEPAPTPVVPARRAETAPVAEAAARIEQPDRALLSSLDDTSSIPVALVANEPRPDLWDPLPVTLPTYVTKPRATRSVRTIDLRETDVMSSGRNADDSALVAEGEVASTDAEQDERRAFGS